MFIRLKRIYDAVAEDDGHRVLVDGMWPRGVAKDVAQLDGWYKELAPSRELRQWFNHEHEKWAVFRHDYKKELAGCDAAIFQDLLARAEQEGLTLLYAAKDRQYNNAVVIKEYLETWRD